jgi:AcrR family transcriptional regulator
MKRRHIVADGMVGPVRLGSDYKAQKHERRRTEVLDAAAAVFAEKGFHTATLKDIADCLNLLPASLYHYVRSKEAALVEVCQRTNDRNIAGMAALLAERPPYRPLIGRAVRLHMVNNRRELVQSFAFRRKDLPSQAAAALSRMAARYQAQWEQLIANAAATGELRPGIDPRAAALAILSMCNGAIDRYESRPPAEIAALAETFSDFILDGLAAPGAPSNHGD